MKTKILFGLLISSFVSIGQVTMQGVTMRDTPDTPYELAKGDFNGDGKMDLVSANFASGANQQITIYLNTGSGTFTGTALRSYGGPAPSLDVAVSDFNEDGKLDVVALSQSTGFHVWLGDGAGSVGAVTTFNTPGGNLRGLDVGDLNKDGHVDVILTSIASPYEVRVFLGNGAGSFTASTIISFTTVHDITVGDFNGDTKLDFAVTIPSTPAMVQIWSGDAAATPGFTLSQTISGFGITPRIIAANLDNDTDLDIVAGNGYIINNGSGTFGAITQLPQTGEDYTVGDLNADGKPDIAATDNNNNLGHIRVYLGDGSGNFTLQAKNETVLYARGIEITDVNGDGKQDIIGAGTSSGEGKVMVLLGESTGYFTNTITKYPGLNDPRDIAKGDFNEDGKIDIAIGQGGTSNLIIFLGQGNGKFVRTPTGYAAASQPVQLITMDYNKDGHIDIVSFNVATLSITVFTGAGDGTFPSKTDISVTSSTLGRITSTDYDGDTNPDIIVSGGSGRVLNLIKGTGSGFNAPITVAVSQDIHDIKAADFNGDGKIDLATTYTSTNEFLVLFGNGTGAFTEGTKYTLQRDLVEIYDLNNDSKPDAVCHSGGAFGNDIYINNGAGTFTASTFNGGLARNGVSYDDMDGDGIKDYVMGAQTLIGSDAGLLRVFRGSASGTFGFESFNKNISGGFKILTHDVNSDGKIDIISLSSNTNEDYLGILINNTGAPACTSPTILSSTSSPTVCAGQNLVLSVTVNGSATFSYQWKKGANNISGATLNSLSLNAITTADAGTYTCVVTNGCGSATTPSIVLTVNAGPCTNQAPAFGNISSSTVPGGMVTIDLLSIITDADNNLNTSSLRIVKMPSSDAEAFISSGVLIIDYEETSFTGTDNITIEVCDLAGSCTQKEFSIEVGTGIIVYNGISPNADAFNRVWVIQNIELSADTQKNKVVVFNRWGDEVFNTVNYDNDSRVFKGLNNSGSELPSGTYFYRIEFESGKSSLTGYLVLKR